MTNPPDPLNGLDPSDRAALSAVVTRLSAYEEPILAAWEQSFQQSAPGHRLEERSRFAEAIHHFFATASSGDFEGFTAFAEDLGRRLAEDRVPFALVPSVVQALTRSYVPFLDRICPGHGLKETVRLLDMLLQRYAQALAVGYFERQEADVHDATARLGELEQVKNDLLSVLSHELRTPLTFIQAYAETLAERVFGELDPEQRAAVEQIMAGAQRMNELVNELMAAGETLAGRIHVRLAPTAIKPLVEREVEKAAARCQESSHRFHVDVPPELPMADADAARLGAAISELLTNACKFSPPGDIEVRARGLGERVELEVADHGRGMSAEERAHAFERFYQATPARLHHLPGVGLGLFLVKSYVEAMGGRVALDSEPGRGTRVRLELPAAFHRTEA